MQQQQQQRIPFDFQGNTFYKTLPNITNCSGNVFWVYDSPLGDTFIGHITKAADEDTFDEFTITSYTGHTYYYNLNREELIGFQYMPPGQMIPLPTEEECEKLHAFRHYVKTQLSTKDWDTGIFHLLDLHERFPEEQVEPIMK